MHWSATPYPWETILFVPSWIIPSDVMNQPWISIATAVVIVAFFGMTVEARQIYCQYAGYLRLQTCFQKLKWKKDRDPSPSDGSGSTIENGKMLLPNRVRNSIEYQYRYATYSPCRAPTTETAYLENKTNYQSLYSRGRDSIIPTIERPDTARATEARSHMPSPARSAINTPPTIPPRYSSLRSSFAFRTPTFQSIRKSIRIPSLRSRATSGTSSKTTGERTELARDDSAAMLPLYSVSRGRRLDRGFQVRVPIAHLPSTLDGRREGHAGMVRVRSAERASFPREQTLASLYTTSDTRTNRSRSTAGREVGVAK
ncbi:hypothetical protein F4680DRAFT_421223 [Xylaria scruposa]|nr:hypothetical protein F4680DRAFT_421223 [Xylaria scruposa]